MYTKHATAYFGVAHLKSSRSIGARKGPKLCSQLSKLAGTATVQAKALWAQKFHSNMSNMY